MFASWAKFKTLTNISHWYQVALFKHPLRDVTQIRASGDPRPVIIDGALVGCSFREDLPDIEYLKEIRWLYGEAAESYRNAVSLDPTDSSSYTALWLVQKQLGLHDDAEHDLHRAITILDKAIQADDCDQESYRERAEIFEELGEIQRALADLDSVLLLTTSEYEIESITKKIENLTEFVREVDASRTIIGLGDSRAIEPLITLLGDEDGLARDRAAKVLIELNAAQLLMAAITHDNWRVRHSAIGAATKLMGSKALEPVIVALSDEHELVRAAAVRP